MALLIIISCSSKWLQSIVKLGYYLPIRGRQRIAFYSSRFEIPICQIAYAAAYTQA
jgi:hypothetical protein